MRAELLMHYAIPNEGLPELATVGLAKVAMFAFRCGVCSIDFHVDHKPNFCPWCGVYFEICSEFGQRKTR
jgi:rubrerythrin